MKTIHGLLSPAVCSQDSERLGSWEYRQQRDDNRGAVEKEKKAVEHFGDDPPFFGDARRGVLVRQAFHVGG